MQEATFLVCADNPGGSGSAGDALLLARNLPHWETDLWAPSLAGSNNVSSLHLLHFILLISFIAEPITHTFKAVCHAFL